MGNSHVKLISGGRKKPPTVALDQNDARFFTAMESTHEWRSELRKLQGDFNPRAMRVIADDPYFLDHPHSMINELAAGEGYLESVNIEKITELVKIFGASILNNDDDDDENFDDDPDDTKISRITPLYVAVDKRNLKMAKALIRLGAELEVRYEYDIPSVLHYAVQKDDVEMSLLLLACGASPHVCDDINHYSLLKVVQSRKIAEALITMGANVNMRSSVGWTNLHTTPVRDHVEVLKTLVANGANPRARDSDAKTTPRNSAFISDESNQFLSLAEKGIKLYKSGNAIPLNTSDEDRQVLRRLKNILDPLVLTDEKRAVIRDDLFARSILRDRHLEDLKRRAVKTFLLCLLCKGRALPSDVLRLIANDFLSPRSWETNAVEGLGQELVGAFDYEEEEFEDGFSSVSDACTENDFAGRNDFEFGYNDNDSDD